MGPLKKTTSLAEFCDEYYTLYLYTKNNHIQARENNPQINYCFKMAAKWPIFVLRHFDFGKNVKNNFLKGIFQWLTPRVSNVFHVREYSYWKNFDQNGDQTHWQNMFQ